MFNQRAGVFNLGCEGIMCMGAFLGFLPPFFLKDGPLAPYGILIGFAIAMVAGVLLGLLFALVTVTFRAEQGIAGIGLQMFGWGVAGTLFTTRMGEATIGDWVFIGNVVAITDDPHPMRCPNYPCTGGAVIKNYARIGGGV